jgi:hypothetical protein
MGRQNVVRNKYLWILFKSIPKLLVKFDNHDINIVTYKRRFCFTMELYCTPKVNTLQLNTAGNSLNTSTRPICSRFRPRLDYQSRFFYGNQLQLVYIVASTSLLRASWKRLFSLLRCVA